MKILVTGADGLLGSNLVRLLLKNHHEVNAFLHPSTKSKTLDGLAIKKFYGDILEPESLTPAFENVDAVVHAAASTCIWPPRSARTKQINIEGTQNIINKSLEFGVSKMIYIGSGSSVNTESNDDSELPFPGAKFGLDYIDSKFEALNLVIDSVNNNKLPAIAILPTFMLGAYDSLPGSGKMVLAVAKGKVKFYTNGGRNFVHVNDVATAILHALDSTKYGKYYIAGGENLSYLDFFTLAAKVTGKSAPRIKISAKLVKGFGFCGTCIGKITGKLPIVTKETAKISCENQFVSSRETIEELHMPQTPVKQAIEDCYLWFKQNNYC